LSVRRVTVRRIVAANCQGDVDVTSIETGPSWVERLNPRHWTLVWKLVIVGLVPALLALTLGVLRIVSIAWSERWRLVSKAARSPVPLLAA